jgi:uncharacterized peroxidase-related enzyme
MFLQGIRAAPLETPQYRDLLAALDEAAVPLPELLHVLSVRPEAALHFGRLMQEVLRGQSQIEPALREMLAAFVAKTRRSFVLLAKHGTAAGELSGDRGLVAAVLDRYDGAPISDREKALFAFVEHVSRDRPITQHDIDRLLRAEWSEEAVLDLILICALMHFAVVLTAATGVKEVPPETNRIWGRFVAEHGYAAE